MGRVLATIKGLWTKLRGERRQEPAENRATAGKTGPDEARSERRREVLERLNSNDPGVTEDRQGMGNSEAEREREIELERGRGVRGGL